MIDLARLQRRPVQSAALLLGGAGLVGTALSQATQAGDSSAYVGALLVGLVGIVGSLVTLVTKLVERREHLVRGDLADRVAQLEQRVAKLESKEKALEA